MKFAALMFITMFVSNAFAQLDPSSGLLLHNDSKTDLRENGLDSGRYTVRPRSDSPAKKIISKTTEKSVEEEEEVTPVPVQVQAPMQSPAPTPLASIQTQQTDPTPAPTPPPPVVIQAEQSRTISAVDESKNNILNMSIAPVYIYNHSQSDFSPRNYSSSSPGYLVDVQGWIRPNFAVHAEIMNSLAASVNDSYDHSRNANLTQQWLAGGFRYRSFMSSQRNASSITLGVDYQDYQFQVDTDAHIRNRLETNGVDLSLSAEIPTSSKYSWELGIHFMPKAKHEETATSAGLTSGNSPDADVLSVSLGGRIYVDSSNQMFWKISEQMEKDQFSGSTPNPDPASQTQTNVSVTNSFTLIQIGYTWGN